MNLSQAHPEEGREGPQVTNDLSYDPMAGIPISGTQWYSL
jgi:hypothetical protein